MTSNPTAQAGTALSPEWDRGFDEAFTELISNDPDLVRAEFDALIDAGFDEPPGPPPPPPPTAAQPAPHGPPPPPAPSAAQPAPDGPPPDPSSTPAAGDSGYRPGAAGDDPRSPPHAGR